MGETRICRVTSLFLSSLLVVCADEGHISVDLTLALIGQLPKFQPEESVWSLEKIEDFHEFFLFSRQQKSKGGLSLSL